MKRLLSITPVLAAFLSLCLTAAAQETQYVVFQLSPRDASVVFDGELLKNDRGYCYKLTKQGIHSYSVSAPGYSTESGKLSVSGAGDRTFLTISLLESEKLGSLDISSEPADSEVELDGYHMGSTPLRLENIGVGKHIIRVVQDGFNPIEQEVTVIRDSLVTVFAVFR